MTANDIRNIALLGHGGSGKTSLAEQMLFMTKGTDRLGRTADGNTGTLHVYRPALRGCTQRHL